MSNTPTGNDFTQIASGWLHCHALKSDGSIVSWGADYDLQVSNTPPGNDFLQITGGGMHSTALKTDGSIVSWGNDLWGQVSNTPTGNDFVKVAGGIVHALAIKFDGSVVSWGNDAFGQVSDTPSGNRVIQIAGGGFHSTAISTREPTLSVSNLAAGQTALVEVANATPNNYSHFAWSIHGGGPISTPFGDAMLTPPYHLKLLSTDSTGYASYTANIPPAAAGITVWCHGTDVGTQSMLNALMLVIQ